MVAALTSGSGPDLIGQLSTTRLAGGGVYSPYVGAVVDLAKMMESFRTPEYRYIPALALPHLGELNLKLNNPPSFRKPMSVMVVSLPAVEAAQLPPLRPVDANQVPCLEKPELLLAAEGAPVVFSTDYAHNMVLHVTDKAGRALDLPATADAARGGFLIANRSRRGRQTGKRSERDASRQLGFRLLRGTSLSPAKLPSGKVDARLG